MNLPNTTLNVTITTNLLGKVSKMQVVNVSNWSSVTIGERIFYSPNNNILALVAANPDLEFWHNTYSAFACLIVNQKRNTIQAIRDHFGLETFFYTTIGNKFTFASNIPDILKQLPSKPQINRTQIIGLLINSSLASAQYTDETYYQNIYRVEPGTILEYGRNSMYKKQFWQLDVNAPDIVYTNNSDYEEHFSQLLTEAVKYQLPENRKIAAEFSGGLDSSSIITTCATLNINPAVFMHTAPEKTDDTSSGISYANDVIKALNLTNVYQIDANNFELLDVIDKHKEIFAGIPSYIFPFCANNIHKAVVDNGFTTLLSGFGGDECVSGHAPLSIFLTESMKKREYKMAWYELTKSYHSREVVAPYKLKSFLQLMKLSEPRLFYLFNKITSIPTLLQHSWQNIPYTTRPKVSQNIRQHEYEYLQGKFSQHVRMRIEDSALIAKTMGFEYKYPLLYPPLVEFCFRLPRKQKRCDGVNRLLLRKYLAKYLPQSMYTQDKRAGLAIMPATMKKIETEYKNGKYATHFRSLPYQRELNWIHRKYQKNNPRKFDKELLMYSLKSFLH